MLRSLVHYWRVNLALTAAVAVTCAVITGGLIVGDSVRASLSRLVLDRLGPIDSVLLTQRFVNESLALRLNDHSTFQEHSITATPVIFMPGSSTRPVDQSRASGVRLYGVDKSFGTLFEERLRLERVEGQSLPGAVINASLGQELGAGVGDHVLFHLMGVSEVARESLLGERDSSSVVKTMRAVIQQVVDDEGVGQFEIRPSQSSGFNAYLPLRDVQRALDQEGRVNLVLFSGSHPLKPEELRRVVKETLRAPDYGFKIRRGNRYLSVESSSFVLKPFQVEAVHAAANRLKLRSQPVLAYLSNRLETGRGAVPYSTVAAVDPIPADDLPRLLLRNGELAAPLEAGALYLNEWAARELAARTGDRVEMTYYEVGPWDEFVTRRAGFQLAGVVAMDAMGSDPLLTPEYPGIHEVEDMARWDPPFPVNLDWIRPQDEEYWDRFGAIPKAFVSLKRGRQLWSSRFGNTTSIRLATDPDFPLTVFPEGFEAELKKELTLDSGGFRLGELRREGLAAARGPTDFAGLFAGFSFFLIVAALLLVALLFRLAVERRSGEVGILSAVGYGKGRVMRRLLAEAGPLLVAGAVVGSGLALFYCWAMLAGLRTFWNEAVGTTLLRVSFTPASLVLGFTGSLVSGSLALWLSVRKLVRLPPANLLAGRLESGVSGPGRWTRLINRASAFLSIAVLAALILLGPYDQDLATLLFFVLGILILLFSLSLVSSRVRGVGQRQLTGGGPFSWWRLALRNVARNPARSLVSVVLVALACFTILTVEASRTALQDNLDQKDSPTGGFELLARTDVPVLRDMNTDSGRFDLGIEDADALLEQTRIYPFRVQPGDDASCLNLYRPRQPRILGVHSDFKERGGFEYQGLARDLSARERDNPWRILDRDLGEEAVAAIGDYESVRWILKSSLGQDLVISDEAGRPVRLRLVGLLHASIFQSEILISEAAFQRLFPSRSGYSYFLVDAPPALTGRLTSSLETWLADYGLDAVGTRDQLARYLAVRNTYVSTFQVLGGLGLVLGTLGLGVVLLRNVLERRRELAVMRAFGFSRADLSKMVVAENFWLLAIGISCGTLAAAVALAPALLSRPDPLPWMSLLGTLILVVTVGMGACSAAVAVSLRTPLLPSLKTER